MKMKEFGPGGGRPWRLLLDPPMNRFTDLSPVSIRFLEFTERLFDLMKTELNY